jgi:hypothetical protein
MADILIAADRPGRATETAFWSYSLSGRGMRTTGGLLPQVAANRNICPFSPELGAPRRVGKGGKVDIFDSAALI